MTYTALPATLEQTVYVAEHLRKEDREELEAASGRPPVDVLVDALSVSSEFYAATLDGDEKPFMLFGVVDDPHDPSCGLVWLVATDRVNAARLMVLRGSSSWLKKWGERYRLLHNFVDKRNTLHVRWLRLMGFSFAETVSWRGHPFQHFTLQAGSQPCANPSP